MNSDTLKQHYNNHPLAYKIGVPAAIAAIASAGVIAHSYGQPQTTLTMAPTANDIQTDVNSAKLDAAHMASQGMQGQQQVTINRIPEHQILTDLDKLEARVQWAKQIEKHDVQTSDLEKKQALDFLYANSLGGSYF